MALNNQANVKAVITAEDRASSTLKRFSDDTQSIGDKISTAFKAIGVAVVADKIKDFAVASVKAFNEAEEAIAQTQAVLKSTGGVAGVTAEQVTNLATAWQKQSKYSDEAVRSAENVLLTFTKISAKEFPQALEAVLNMSTALGQDLKSSAIQVGKALQDPILGITALRRVGVNFSDAQREVVKSLVETGRQGEAQALILQELQTEFGGSAIAAGETFAGAIEKLKNRFNDLQEVIGGKIVQAFQFLAAHSAEIASFIDVTFRPAVENLLNSMQRLGDSLEKLNQEHPNLVKGLGAIAVLVGGVLLELLDRLIGFIATIVNYFNALVNVVNSVGNAFRSMGNTAVSVANSIYGPFKSAFNSIAGAWNNTIGKLSFKFPSWMPGVGGKGIDVPDIPMLADGGIVNQPTLAMIGEKGPEAVVPLNKSNGFGGTINVTFNGIFTGNEIEMRKLAQKVFQAQADNMTMQGA